MKEFLDIFFAVENFNRLLLYGFFFILLATNKKEIVTVLKGGNGVYQMIELITGVCFLFFIIYSIEIIVTHKGDAIFLSIWLTGAGGGQIIKEASFKIPDKQNKNDGASK